MLTISQSSLSQLRSAPRMVGQLIAELHSSTLRKRATHSSRSGVIPPQNKSVVVKLLATVRGPSMISHRARSRGPPRTSAATHQSAATWP